VLALSVLHAEHAAARIWRKGPAFESRNPLLRISGGGVIIDAVASSDPNTLMADLEGLRMQDISRVGRVVSGLLPIESIDDIEALGSLQFARPSYALTRGGLANSQGDAAMRADDARVLFGVDGTGVTVGTLSDSFDCDGTEALSDVSSRSRPRAPGSPLRC